MKNFLKIFITTWILSFSFSCSNDLLLNDDQFIINPDSLFNKENYETKAAYVCGGGCLPKITTYHDPSIQGAVIQWGSNLPYLPYEHEIVLSYVVAGSYSTQIINASYGGQIQKYIPYSNYDLYFTLTCNGRYWCSDPDCTKSGVLRMDSSNGYTNEPIECNNTYMPFRILEDPSERFRYHIIFDENYDPYEYLKINKASFHTIDHFYKTITSTSSDYGSFIIDNSTGIQKLSFKLLQRDPNVRSYAIRLYSDKCNYSSQHYFQAEYYFTSHNASPTGLWQMCEYKRP